MRPRKRVATAPNAGIKVVRDKPVATRKHALALRHIKTQPLVLFSLLSYPPMADWTIDPFDNDAASQWVSDLVDEDNLDLVHLALSSAMVPTSEALDSRDAQRAIAAAELLALLAKNPSPYLCEDLRHWVQVHRPNVCEEMLEMADAALVRILGPHSELRAMWQDEGKLDILRESLETLRMRLHS